MFADIDVCDGQITVQPFQFDAETFRQPGADIDRGAPARVEGGAQRGGRSRGHAGASMVDKSQAVAQAGKGGQAGIAGGIVMVTIVGILGVAQLVNQTLIKPDISPNPACFWRSPSIVSGLPEQGFVQL